MDATDYTTEKMRSKPRPTERWKSVQYGASLTTTKTRTTTGHGRRADMVGEPDWAGGCGGKRLGTATPGALTGRGCIVQRLVTCLERHGHGMMLLYDGADNNPTL